MKVSSLVEQTQWQPGRRQAAQPPTLSVLLPTYRRGRDGLLSKVLSRILSQSFTDFELIIIDDASTDGSATVIQNVMSVDARVSCLTHSRNIGLPAISEYEAYQKSTGNYVIFAFDDYIFENDAFEILVAFAQLNPECLVHGYSQIIDENGRTHYLGKDPKGYDRLVYENYIANSSFLVSRAILDDIGLYDPNILAARLCDWDLLRRINRKYRFRYLDRLIGCEWGLSRRDSLGNSYPIFFETMQEYFGENRDELLRPANFALRDVWEIPQGASVGLVESALCSREFFSSKDWADHLPVAADADFDAILKPKRRIIGIVAGVDPTPWLFFDGLSNGIKASLQFIDPSSDFNHNTNLILQCDVVVIVRYLFEPRNMALVKVCESYGIPRVYFTDDNFASIDDYRGTPYSDTNKVAEYLSNFSEVWCGSKRLADYYSFAHIHQKVRSISPVFNDALLNKYKRREGENNTHNVGIVGGDFRKVGFFEDIVPALRSPELVKGLTLYIPNTWRVDRGLLPFKIIDVERTGSFGLFLDRWTEARVDVILHPRCETDNVTYKNDNVLLTSLYLGAVPVVADEFAFSGLGEEQGVILVERNRPDAWLEAIDKLRDPQFRSIMLKRLRDYCMVQFSSDLNEAVISQLMQSIRPTSFVRRRIRDRSFMSDRVSIGNSVAVDERIRLLEAELQSRAYKVGLFARRVMMFLRKIRECVRRILPS